MIFKIKIDEKTLLLRGKSESLNSLTIDFDDFLWNILWKLVQSLRDEEFDVVQDHTYYILLVLINLFSSLGFGLHGP